MIGKSLRERYERYELGMLSAERAVAVVTEVLASQAEHLVRVRAKDARMIACLIVRADKPTLRLCRELGFDVRPGGSGVFGLLGTDAARLFDKLPSHQRTWLETSCGPRETKVLLVAGGTALVSLETNEGKVAVSAFL